jgi:hypothetical protein
MSALEERPEVKEVAPATKEFKFEEAKVSDMNKEGSVTVSLTKESGYMAQAANPEESKRVLAEIGEYQKQANTWAKKRAVEALKGDKKIQKVRVKTPAGSKDEKLLSVSVTAVRERQLGPDNKGPYIASAINSSAFADKSEMKSLRERLAAGLK